MQSLQYLRVQSFINLFQNYGYKVIIATYCTRPKKFHEALFDRVREVRKKTEEKSFEPAKLHMVKRIRKISGLPYWEKLLLRKIGLEEDYPGVSIVKNTPSINKLLWEVKHVVRVVPITFPNGYPKEGDYSGTYLKRNGEFIISPKLKVDPQLLLIDPEKEKKKLDSETIVRECRRKWPI